MTLQPAALDMAKPYVPDSLMPLFERWRDAQRVLITTSSLCSTQLNRFVVEHAPELAARFELDAAARGMNDYEPAPHVPLITPTDMAEWVFAVALEVEPLFAERDVTFEVVVNDFPLSPAQRKILKVKWPDFFPSNLTAVAAQSGCSIEAQPDRVVLHCEGRRPRTLRFKFESTLRNAAGDGLSTMIRKGRARKLSDGATAYQPIAGRVHVRSNATYRYQPQESVALTAPGTRAPLCSSIMMYHFIRQPVTDLFINVAGMDMTCGYRNGVEAYLNLANAEASFVNLFFDEPGEEDAYYDVYEPQ